MSKQKTIVKTEDLSGNLALGYIHLDITTARIIATNDIQNTTEAGVPDGNTAGPKLLRVNAGTDKALRLTWAANEVNELQFAPVLLPPDLDTDAIVKVRLLCAKDANANTVTIDVQAFAGVGDTEMGATTATIAQSLASYDVELAAADIPVHPTFLNIALVPSAHAGDALYLYAAAIVYTRKA